MALDEPVHAFPTTQAAWRYLRSASGQLAARSPAGAGSGMGGSIARGGALGQSVRQGDLARVARSET
jgi:hypothetical protein